MKKTTRLYVAAFVFFGAAIGWLCFAGFTEDSVYFLNVSEAKAAAPEKLKQARLFGVVADEALDQSMSRVSFRLLDKDDPSLHIPVSYHGLVPDAFKPGAEVIVEGGMDSGAFMAKTLMTKCPSKYQKESRS